MKKIGFADPWEFRRAAWKSNFPGKYDRDLQSLCVKYVGSFISPF